jgi:hypothetical protein
LATADCGKIGSAHPTSARVSPRYVRRRLTLAEAVLRYEERLLKERQP